MSAEGTALTFKYDHNGLRTQKTVQTDWLPETTNYFLLGKLLTHMTVEYTDFDEVAHQDKLHFFYDAQSRPAQVSFNGVIYTYIHNLQGDIVGILDNSGALVVEYKYDAWGKLLSVTGNLKDTLGKRNPFRYRGYVYDEETGLYYLRSRYYNPNVGRFVNADTRLGDVGSICSHNVYAYCANIPVLSADPSGREAVILIYAFLEAVATAAATAAEITALASLCFKVGNAIGKTVSSTFAAAGVSSVKVETSAITNPKSLAREITAADVRYLGIESNFITGEAFYVAYAINNTENSPIFFVNYPLTLQQAKSILGMTGLLNDIIDTVSVGYASGVLGVYTPSKASAALLSKEVGGGSVEQEHFSSTDFPGTYFWHYDGPGHNYHIWYGLPLS